MKAYKVLGERIKKIRLDNGLTQQQFAEYLGYAHKSMVNKIETGQTIDIMFKLYLRNKDLLNEGINVVNLSLFHRNYALYTLTR